MIQNSARNAGYLYIVATPIGNRDDISLRALNVLQTVDVILAEDTRHSGQLLTTHGIKKPLISLHAHNEEQKSISIIQEILAGKTFALISDAGTPLISDPGFPLVKQAREHEVTVIPIPGACAFITALSAAGVPCDTFTFAGFLPTKTSTRQQKLHDFLTINHTLVFYESTHRIVDCIEDINHVFGEDCELVLVKELTKTFERFISGNSQEIKNWLTVDEVHQKGEFILIIPPRKIIKSKSNHEELLITLLNELPLKQAVKIASKITQEPKNSLYKLALDIENTKS